MSISQYIKHYFMWSNFAPADEREVALYHTARKQSYYFLVAILFSTPIIMQQVQELLAEQYSLLFMLGYVVLGSILAEWIGGYTMRNVDLTLKHYVIFANKEFPFAGLFVLIGFVIFSSFAIYGLSTISTDKLNSVIEFEGPIMAAVIFAVVAIAYVCFNYIRLKKRKK